MPELLAAAPEPDINRGELAMHIAAATAVHAAATLLMGNALEHPSGHEEPPSPFKNFKLPGRLLQRPDSLYIVAGDSANTTTPLFTNQLPQPSFGEYRGLLRFGPTTRFGLLRIWAQGESGEGHPVILYGGEGERPPYWPDAKLISARCAFEIGALLAQPEVLAQQQATSTAW